MRREARGHDEETERLRDEEKDKQACRLLPVTVHRKKIKELKG